MVSISANVLSINTEVESMSQEVDVLNSKQIVEDFFWTNPEDHALVENYCFDAFQVGANETVDFSANMSTGWAPSTRWAVFWLTLNKDGQEVAKSVDDKGMIWDDSSVN